MCPSPPRRSSVAGATSPFPYSTLRISMHLADQQVQSNSVVGTKQFTISSRPRAHPHSFHSPHIPTGLPGSTPLSSSPLSRLVYTPTQVTTIKSGATTYAPPHGPGIPPPTPLNKMLPMGEVDEAFMNAGSGATPPPPKPAYPAFSKGSPVPATPRAQDPLAAWGPACFPGTTIELPRSGAPPRPLYCRRSHQCWWCQSMNTSL